ncbi:MAG: hypothetical protein U0821_23530 [Chloroflexota bacterium]
MPDLPVNVLRYGHTEALPVQRQLRAGPLTMVFEHGDLRWIRYGGTEAMRRLYVAVRDQNWNTAPTRLSDLVIDQNEDAFRVSFAAEHRLREIHFGWRGEITGESDGTVRFVMDGEARTTFLRNRVGICVLHPAAAAGASYAALRDDGTVEHGRLPVEIAPHQPTHDLRAFMHEVEHGTWLDAHFEGDVFEMEDQRNWTDASFKTYSTPLRLPFPVRLEAGSRVRQVVTLRPRGRVQPRPVAPPSALIVGLGQPGGTTLPRIGLGSASHGQALTDLELRRLSALRPSHLRVDLRLDDPGWGGVWERAKAEARALGTPLELAVFASDDAGKELAALAVRLATDAPPIAHVLVFGRGEASARLYEMARSALGSGVLLGGGSTSYFTQLNRNRPPTDALDLVCYSINPQVHQFDNASMVETLEGQRLTVRSTRGFAGGRPIVISPITLRPRFNADASKPEPAPDPGELPRAVDARQMSLFGAAWTVGSLRHLAESGVYSATYFETTGWRGVMERAEGSPDQALFPSIAGGVFPIYHALADIGEFGGGTVVPVSTSDPLRIDGVAVRRGGRTRLLLGNLTNAPQHVEVSGLAASATVRSLDERNAERAMREPEGFRAERGGLVKARGGLAELELLPYGVARIDMLR